ncbi:uncharacterized protein ACRADG_004406 [Cochliomyia hominivorax]
MLTRNILTILLIALLRAQLSLCQPSGNISNLKKQDLCLMKTKYDDMGPSENDKLLKSTDQLLKLTLNNFQDLSLKYSKKAKSISEELLKDPAILNANSPQIAEFKTNLTKFEEKYSDCDGIDDLFDLAELYSNTTSYYYELKPEEIKGDTKLILDLLRKYGSEDMDNEFEREFNVFVNNFHGKFSELKEDLKKEESPEASKVLEWHKQFKTLKTYDDKIEGFEEFFKIYDDREGTTE